MNIIQWFYICITGTYDKDGIDSGGTIGWSVTFNNADNGNSKSTTTWSGQRQLGSDGNPVIRTTWLMTTQTPSYKNWESTSINQDVFHRGFPKDKNVCDTLKARGFKEHTC